MSLIPSHETFQNVHVESSTRSGGRRSRRVVGDLFRRSQILCSVRIPNDEKKSPLLKSNRAKSASWGWIHANCFGVVDALSRA